MEFFKSGLTKIIKLWLQNGCKETPEEMFEIVKSEYIIPHPGPPASPVLRQPARIYPHSLRKRYCGSNQLFCIYQTRWFDLVLSFAEAPLRPVQSPLTVPISIATKLLFFIWVPPLRQQLIVYCKNSIMEPKIKNNQQCLHRCWIKGDFHEYKKQPA